MFALSVGVEFPLRCIKLRWEKIPGSCHLRLEPRKLRVFVDGFFAAASQEVPVFLRHGLLEVDAKEADLAGRSKQTVGLLLPPFLHEARRRHSKSDGATSNREHCISYIAKTRDRPEPWARHVFQP